MKLKTCDGCQKDKPIYKNRLVDGVRYRLCKECNFKEDLKVSPNKNQIAKRTQKKVLLDKVYSIKRKQYLEKNEHCQAAISPRCSHIATEIHHKSYRTGENYLDDSTWCAVCRDCHSKIHSFPAEARERGLLN